MLTLPAAPRRTLSLLAAALLALAAQVVPSPVGATSVAAAPPAPLADALGLTLGATVADVAAGQVGAGYAWGGASPAGFDCTGFVQWVYGQVGVALPRSEAGQLASGPLVAAEELRPGDVLVFANTYRWGLSHAGIYLGQGRFVHAVDERHGVTVSSLWDAYWSPRLAGASRPAA